MKMWEEIRRRVHREGVSKREILRETGMHWMTLEKILAHAEPPGYRQAKPRPKLKIGPFVARIEEIIETDKGRPKKQRHTAKRIFERLKEEGYTGGYTQVKEAVRQIRQQKREVFVPLTHRPGEAQADFGFALIKEAGTLRKVAFFVMALPYSGAIHLQIFDRICTEVWWEGHVRAFEFFGGAPWRISYDNDKCLVAKIVGAHERELTRGFLQLKSHYLFDTHFCRVRRANEKGVVESMVKYARLNFLVPVPSSRNLAELNTQLTKRCREDLENRQRGKAGTKGVRLEEERSAFLPLPVAPFEACRKISTTVNSFSLVRFDSNDYSVPIDYAHGPVVVKAYTDRVALCRQGAVVAEHTRLWGKEDVSFEPRHYLRLLQRKPGALDHARPLEGWALPECFGVLRRRLEAERDGEGVREYIRVLRLLEGHPMGDVRRAVEKGLRVDALTRDAIAQWLHPREEWRATRFRLDGRDHLRRVRVEKTDVSRYGELLPAGGVR